MDVAFQQEAVMLASQFWWRNCEMVRSGWWRINPMRRVEGISKISKRKGDCIWGGFRGCDATDSHLMG